MKSKISKIFARFAQEKAQEKRLAHRCFAQPHIPRLCMSCYTHTTQHCQTSFYASLVHCSRTKQLLHRYQTVREHGSQVIMTAFFSSTICKQHSMPTAPGQHLGKVGKLGKAFPTFQRCETLFPRSGPKIQRIPRYFLKVREINFSQSRYAFSQGREVFSKIKFRCS